MSATLLVARGQKVGSFDAMNGWVQEIDSTGSAANLPSDAYMDGVANAAFTFLCALEDLALHVLRTREGGLGRPRKIDSAREKLRAFLDKIPGHWWSASQLQAQATRSDLPLWGVRPTKITSECGKLVKAHPRAYQKRYSTEIAEMMYRAKPPA